MHAIRPHGDDIVGKEVVDHIVGQLVIRSIGVVLITLLNALVTLGRLDVQTQLLPGIASDIVIAVDLPGCSHAFQWLTDDLTVVLHRRHKGRKPTSVVTIGESVELAVLIVSRDIRHQLRVEHLNVISLIKVVGNDLPVAARLGRHIEDTQHVFHPVRIQLAGDGLAQKILQRCGLGIKVEPHQTEALRALHLLETRLTARALGKILFVGHHRHHTGTVKTPAVIRTGELLNMAVLSVGNAGAAMWA